MLIGFTEQGFYEKRTVLVALLRERGAFSDRRQTTRSYRKFCGKAQERHCAHRRRMEW